MKTAITLDGGISVVANDLLEISDEAITWPGFRMPLFNSLTARIIDVELPENWCPFGYAWANDAWAVADQNVINTHLENEKQKQVPKQVTRRQAKAALILSGKLGMVQPAIDSIQDPLQKALMQNEWDESLEFERQRPSLIALASAIGLSSSQLDDLFILASQQA